MQYYLEILPDYQAAPSLASSAGKGDDQSSESSPATTKGTTHNTNGSNHNQEHIDFDEMAQLKM